MDQNKSRWSGSFSTPPQSYWMASTPTTHYPKLESDISVDVAIVGGGMVGITCAYLLKKEGFKCAIVDADRIIQGTSGHTTAKVTSQHNLIYYKILQHMGQEKAQQYADANQKAISLIEKLSCENKIECDFIHKSAYVYTNEDKFIQQIKDETATAKKLGIKAEYLDTVPLPLPSKAAVRFDGQAQFHPRKYLLGLAKLVHGDGSQIFEQTRAVDIEEGETCNVICENGRKITARYVIVASHFPYIDGTAMFFARLHPERSYALGVTLGEKFPDGMFITAEDPGRSFRTQPFEGGELVIVGGEHHKTGQGGDTQIHYENLLNYTCEYFDLKEVYYRWSTHDYGTLDDVPYVGHHAKSKNIFVATGFRKWGMTNSTASAVILRDLILQGKSPWQEVYSPSRFVPDPSLKTLAKENFNVAVQLISGKLSPVPEDVDIPMGEAKVIEMEGHKVGAYRDLKNKLHVVDPSCTHMGCELKWNSAEKSWDCPCHGSRFTYEGDIIEGPALKKLHRFDDGE